MYDFNLHSYKVLIILKNEIHLYFYVYMLDMQFLNNNKKNLFSHCLPCQV